MALFKNRKGIIHELDPALPRVKKWLKDEQIKPLTEAETAKYLKDRGIGVKKTKATTKEKATWLVK